VIHLFPGVKEIVSLYTVGVKVIAVDSPSTLATAVEAVFTVKLTKLIGTL
jgi:hypothetical protein